jgi:hypothetical protein
MLKPKKSRTKRGVPRPARAVLADLNTLRAVTAGVAAGALRLPSSSFRRYVRAGILPKSLRHGVHDLLDLLGVWIDYIATDRTKDPDIGEAKRRFWVARADREEIERDAALGQLIPVSLAHQIIVDALTLVRVQTDAIAGRLAMEVAAMTDPAIVRRTLLDEHRRIHEQASEQLARLYGTANGGGEPGGADAEATTDDTGAAGGEP